MTPSSLIDEVTSFIHLASDYLREKEKEEAKPRKRKPKFDPLAAEIRRYCIARFNVENLDIRPEEFYLSTNAILYSVESLIKDFEQWRAANV